MDFSTAITILYVLLALDVVFILLIVINKLRKKQQIKIEAQITEDIKNLSENRGEITKIKHKFLFLRKYIDLNQNLELNVEIQKRIVNHFLKLKLDTHFMHKLGSPFSLSRIEGASYLGHIHTNETKQALESALKKEKNHTVALYIANALSIMGDKNSIPLMTGTLPGAPEWYRNKIMPLLFEYGGDFFQYMTENLDRKEPELVELFISFSSHYRAKEIKNYLLNHAQGDASPLRDMALKQLAEHYPQELLAGRFAESDDITVKKYRLQGTAFFKNKEALIRLVPYLTDPETREEAAAAVSSIIQESPHMISVVVDRFYNEQDRELKKSWAGILSNRLEYFFLKLISKDRERIKELLYEILLSGKMSETIGFLNKNKNREIENEILAVLRRILKEKPEFISEFQLYLDPRILKKLKLEKKEIVSEKREEKKEKSKIRFLFIILTLVVLLFPVVFITRRFDFITQNGFDKIISLFVVDFNYLLVFYSSTINGIYIIILVFSFIGSSFQSRYWRIKMHSFLFKKNILPSISIIAPAYCEEATIIESVNSLLNLKYPDYELIVVNDGSKDNTINVLIDYYKLEKRDRYFEKKLNTKPVRGIYTNKNIPKLVVVDKANGGKADSLNAGINISTRDYFCGIDADSLLEQEALLKAASLMLDTQAESVAVGGNIFPINGCSIDKGMLTNIALPKHILAVEQTMEYLRAFMAGRIGWAFINCLLIISGAFGIFSKKRIIEIGGYLTSSGKYQKDTVGEDMELVVRLSRHMREKKRPHSIHYSFNANCWTEVPESFTILGKQRDRWHRGLIDILSFHRKIIFNPKYGSMGLVSIPYFFIFEMIGPLIECQGYIMLILAAVLGLMNPTIALLLFISTIALGTVVSLSSLLIAEKDEHYFSLKEIGILLLYALGENFGFRQLISFWRVSGFINSMKKPKGWGKMVRKGFAGKK